jgi:hypothetical protein
MKKVVVCTILIFLFSIMGYVTRTSIQNTAVTDINSALYETTMKQDLLCLMMAYPEYITDIERLGNGKVYLMMKSGKRILYDDNRIKSLEEKMNNPDLQDMMEQKYPLSHVTKLMDKNFDPGRIRVYGLLNEVYGGSKQKVESSLVNVSVGKTYQFNENNKAAQSLQNAMKELIPLSQNRKDIAPYVFPCSGTYNYRVISETNRLSPHAFGIAIDFARDKKDYWKWASPEQGQERLASYPREMVEILEKNDFVWGGKWGHFDILHFEYRPEIIIQARYFGGKNDTKKLWYDGLPVEEANVKDYIQKINQVLK